MGEGVSRQRTLQCSWWREWLYSLNTQGGDGATVKERWQNRRKNTNIAGIIALGSNAQQLL